jgi:hypothetical protein
VRLVKRPGRHSRRFPRHSNAPLAPKLTVRVQQRSWNERTSARDDIASFKRFLQAKPM